MHWYNLIMQPILVLLLLLTIGGVAIYNRLVTFRNQYKNAFAQIDVQLRRRYDLIPNLVETAKAYLKHERETLEAVIAARNLAYKAREAAAADPGSAMNMQALSGAEAALGGALARFFALSEAYPDLKANQNMAQLSEELTSTENRVAFARQAFNDAVMHYNTAREMFPSVLFAGALGFGPATAFQILDSKERDTPQVKF